MKRNWFAEIVIIALVCALLCTVTWFVSKAVIHRNEYGMTARVYNISEATDTVTLIDYNGNLWQFKGVEDWAYNDIVSCVMDSKGTNLIKDDEIVKVRYSGSFDNGGYFFNYEHGE